MAKATKKTSKRIRPTKDVAKTTMTMPVMENKVLENKKPMKLGKSVIFILVLVLIGAVLYFAKSLLVAATVNGRPVSRLSILKSLEKSGGKQALDSMVTKELINQEAKKKNIVISDEDVQKEIEKLSETVKTQGTTLDAALSSQNMTKEDLMQNIRMQKTVEQLLASQIKVSDEDIKAYFDKNKATYGKDAKYDDLKDSIKKDLEQEKLATEFQTWYQKLQAESSIKYFVSY